MTNLHNFSERNYIMAMRSKAAARAERLAKFQIVIESVHPGHFGQLPPSPDVLESKAYLLGI
jgi:hypothetical protein